MTPDTFPAALVEQVARALRDTYCSPGRPASSWEEQTDNGRHEWLSFATAALSALPAAVQAVARGEAVAMTPTREDVNQEIARFTHFYSPDYRPKTAAILRALLARAEAAELARDAAIREMAAMARQAGSWQGIAEGKDAVIRQIEAERDAARAEIARLRRLWNYMHEAASDIEADEPMTAAEWLAEFTAAEQITRAALATEACDE